LRTAFTGTSFTATSSAEYATPFFALPPAVAPEGFLEEVDEEVLTCFAETVFLDIDFPCRTPSRRGLSATGIPNTLTEVKLNVIKRRKIW
jgi:hypothetical protein